MRRRLIAVLLAGAAAFAQQPPKFEVASIKPNKSPSNSGTWRYGDDGRFLGENIPVKLLMMTAFKLKESQFGNLPGWAESEKFDIEAKVGGHASQEEIFVMLQNLLADRFDLKYHRAKKKMQIYAMVQGKRGVKAKESKDEPCPADVVCGSWFSGRNHLEGTRITMPQVADALTFSIDGIVVDKTGLRKAYDIKLAWSPDPDDAEQASIFTAVQEQLGLKLEAAKAPVDILVVDRIERPSEN